MPWRNGPRPKVVDYKIVGDFTGKMVTLQGTHARRAPRSPINRIRVRLGQPGDGGAGQAGDPKLPTKSPHIPGAPGTGTCPPPRIEGAAEFASVTRVTAKFVLLQIELKQQTAGGALPWTGARAEREMR